MERYQEREKVRREKRKGRSDRENHRKRPKKKSHKVYAFFVLLLGCVIIGVTFFLLFYVQKITVSGNEYTTDQEIIESVRSDRYSVNSLYILGKYALEKGEVLPCLEQMKIRMKAPWSLKVTVKREAYRRVHTKRGELRLF